MTRRSSRMLAAAVGLWLANPLLEPASAQAPPGEPARLSVGAAPTVMPNQRVADAIAARLRSHGALSNYRIEIAFDGTTAELTGQVADARQRVEAVRLVQQVPGVAAVRNNITVAQSPIARVTAVTQAQAPAPGEPGPLGGKEFVPPPPGVVPPPGMPQEPVPIFAAPPGLQGAANHPPPLPPYAWPTFAAYNNFSRVGYPSIYPPNAFPFIGPMHPFPKVPLGWRSVKLSYYDGHWWYGKRATGHDWWRIRYW